MKVWLTLSFLDEDKVGTMQPYDDTLMVTLRIGGYNVIRVLVYQGNGTEIMYPNLFKGLKLRSEDLTCYDPPLIGFNGKIVFLKGQIRIPVQIGIEVIEVNFIVVNAYSLYTAIVARPWLHTMGAISSILHLNQSKVLVLPMDKVAEGAKCEQLEKVVIGNDEEKFFQFEVQLPP
ncbi:uncharacterized protein LOC111997668 [Quercus suber]|uniref:uncharacterized protein LOC111997668 n=1 Tax=Quercus suber TaxID=58331 RepID=UPI000CE1F120|nr:uncharacterized protein LOC111997668 [Quercus suber]